MRPGRPFLALLLLASLAGCVGQQGAPDGDERDGCDAFPLAQWREAGLFEAAGAARGLPPRPSLVLASPALEARWPGFALTSVFLRPGKSGGSRKSFSAEL